MTPARTVRPALARRIAPRRVGRDSALQPTPGVHNFEFRGPSPAALQKFAALFGITTIPDQGLTPRNVRITLDNVDWETGSKLLAQDCKILLIPLCEHQVLLANDTEENRTRPTST